MAFYARFLILPPILSNNIQIRNSSLRSFAVWPVKRKNKLAPFKKKAQTKVKVELRKKTVVKKMAPVIMEDTTCTYSDHFGLNFNQNVGAVLHRMGELRLEQIPIPKCNTNEVLIATESIGLSRSDLSFIFTGKYKDYSLEDPIFLGDRVAIEPIIPCKHCELCKRGRFNLCQNIQISGMPNAKNGMLSRFFVCSEDCCFKLPHNVTFDQAALLEPVAIADHACRRGGITVGSKVLISGAGPIGLLNMLCAKAYGATTIVITDIKSHRLRCANRMGANTTICIEKSIKEGCLMKEIIRSLRGPAHVCLECSGSPQATRIASEVVMPGGTIVLVGGTPADTAINTKCIGKEVDIRGVNNYCNNFHNALELIASGRLDFRPMITHDYRLIDIKKAVDVAKSGTAIKILIHSNPKWIPNNKKS